MTILVTGGAGFIGSNFVIDWLASPEAEPVINLDKLTYAGHLSNLQSLANDCRHMFIHGDIGDVSLVAPLLDQHKVRAIVNFAAESHVDRSIHGPQDFINTNVVGTFHLLQVAREYWSQLSTTYQADFRFLHVSTDEVYGSLLPGEPAFVEKNRYQPNNPYAASKAAADHLVRAWHQTYGMPVLTTNCSNNYGPYHFPEKLIPLVILNALAKKSIPIYGDGQQIRDWLYVADHCAALRAVLSRGVIGQTYNIGGFNEKSNLEVVKMICRLLDELHPRNDHISYATQIKFVTDRPGHDRRYAIDSTKIQKDLGWHPVESFETGMRKTVQWYLDHREWVAGLMTLNQDGFTRQYVSDQA